jgi:threonine synthase
MKLRSTTNEALEASWRDAVLRGLAPDGGLYVPTELPHLTEEYLEAARKLPFPDLAAALAKLFLKDEVPDATIGQLCRDSFTFDVPLKQVAGATYILELFHGPTCAFKDFGARFMAGLFRYFLGSHGQRLTVLVATSGDTGSAVANAFFDSSPSAPIDVAILFPRGKVSLVQEKQMTTLGHNVTAYEVDGTFDDCQRLVKLALADHELQKQRSLTSANSINIARLLPQMFYYVHAALQIGDPKAPIFSVPSGNLGNLTGGIIAHLMGLPVTRFIAACNRNDVFPDYLATGEFTPRPSAETISNAMDVGNPSNFARIVPLYGASIEAIRADVCGYGFSDEETLEAISIWYERTGYILDPHTAVGVLALEKLRATRSTHYAPGIVLATAHPAKFSDVVRRAISIDPPIPAQLQEALDKPGHKIALSNSYEDLKSRLC